MSAEFLVTGASGFVGGALVRRMSELGHTVVCPVRREAPALRALPGVIPVVTHLDDPQALSRDLLGYAPNWVFHCAAAGVKLDDRTPQALVTGNVATLAALMSAATHWPVRRFVLLGSCAEYGKVGPQAVDESTALMPSSGYGGAKAAASMLALGLSAQLRVPLLILRLFGTFGPGEGPQRLLPYLIGRLAQGLACPLSPGDQVRDLTWIDDVVDALMLTTQMPVQAERIFNLCSGKGISVREVGERVADRLGAPRSLLQWGALPHRDDEPRVLIGDPRRFQQATGWRATTDLDTAIERMRASLRNTEARDA